MKAKKLSVVPPRRSALSRPPAKPIDAIAWAVGQMPPGWEAGEWLARLMPGGIWSDMEPEELADQIVGAATRAWHDDPPKD